MSGKNIGLYSDLLIKVLNVFPIYIEDTLGDFVLNQACMRAEDVEDRGIEDHDIEDQGDLILLLEDDENQGFQEMGAKVYYTYNS